MRHWQCSCPRHITKTATFQTSMQNISKLRRRMYLKTSLHAKKRCNKRRTVGVFALKSHERQDTTQTNLWDQSQSGIKLVPQSSFALQKFLFLKFTVLCGPEARTIRTKIVERFLSQWYQKTLAIWDHAEFEGNTAKLPIRTKRDHCGHLKQQELSFWLHDRRSHRCACFFRCTT